MDIITKKEELRRVLAACRQNKASIGFVPTMGCLHEGHLALAEHARSENDIVVLSIFVNPMQFGPNEDFDTYPRDLANDEKLARALGVDALFIPATVEMYPEEQLATVEVAKLSSRLCGAYRTGHFRSVATIVLKLINIVAPDRLYMGKKDAQQLIIISRMIEDLNVAVELVSVETVREPDGLAKSSRNSMLSGQERQAAALIPKALTRARDMIDCGERSAKCVITAVQETLSEAPLLKPEYIEIVDRKELTKMDAIKGEALLALAVYAGRVRLIDNLWIDV